ncbi:CoA-binding protein [Aquirufa sp. HETE-83D]|uniref:CoA-binding protein n=1 Tax=Aquirufa esocilacus TaxID=3096513 RepID=A0ABW6DJI1_9BACT
MKVLVYGASTNPSRYAYIATELLLQHGHEVSLVGIKKGEVLGLTILQDQPELSEIDTVTLYVGPANQEGLLNYLSALSPRRVIFNPGTENQVLEKALQNKGIEVEKACTLVLLHTGQF